MLGPEIQALPYLVVAAVHAWFMTKWARRRKVAGAMSTVCHKEASGSFLKKRTKKLLLLQVVAPAGSAAPRAKIFLLLFVYKKTSLLSFPPRMFVTRFAPSPTGFLHLGHAFSAWTAFSRARAAGGQFLLRLEDIDQPRCKPAFAAAILEDLAWLGIAWDGEVRVQSAHLAEYAAALELLAGRGLLYPCFCSRSDILRAQSAPHGTAGVYPGTCRALSAAERRRRIESGALYALRLDVSRALQGAPALRFFEEGTGWVEAQPGRPGDVILARRDVPTSYHLCVVYDDALQGVTHVIRGDDLADSTHVHALLQHLLGWPAPIYAHHRLLTDAGGRRLAKRDFAATLRSMREAGESAESVLRKF